MRLSDDLTATVPYGRAENPVTKTNWEGVGVKPEIVAPAEDALAAALNHLGHRPTRKVAEAGASQVFSPRTTPTLGAREILSQAIAAAKDDDPDLSFVSTRAAKGFPRQAAFMRTKLEGMGRLQEMTFRGPNFFNGDTYDATFEQGSLRFDIVLDAQGKLEGINVMSLPSPP